MVDKVHREVPDALLAASDVGAGKRAARAPVLFALALVFALGACRKDPSLKATKAECDEACAHAVGTNTGDRDTFTARCPSLCIEREWTVGDVRCLSDATTYEGVKNCAVAAKVALADDELRAREAAIAQQKGAAEEEVKRQAADAKAQSERVNALLVQLANAKDEAEKARLLKQLEDEKAKQDEMAKSRGGSGRVRKPKCRPGDPLCSDN